MGSPGLYTSSSSSPFLLLFFSFLAFLDFLASLACLFLLLVLAHSFLPPLPLFSSFPLFLPSSVFLLLLVLPRLCTSFACIVLLFFFFFFFWWWWWWFYRGRHICTPAELIAGRRGKIAVMWLRRCLSCSADPRARTPPGEEEPPSSLTTRHTSLVSAVYEIFIGIFRWPGDSHFRGNRGGNDRFAYAIYDFDRETNRERRWAWVGADVSTDDSSLD